MLGRFAIFFSSLQARLVVAATVLLLASILSVAWLSFSRLNAQISADIERRTLASLRVATRLFTDGTVKHATFKTEANAAGEPERLLLSQSPGGMAAVPEADLTAIVDAITYANGGTATVFRWSDEKKDFVRIATTVKKPDGSRAVGTVLGQGGIVYPFMMRKEAYRGTATILGDLHQTGYLPIIDSNGAPAGILYIGIGKIAALSAESGRLLSELIIGVVVTLVVAGGLLWLGTLRLLAPLLRVAGATSALAAGKLDVAVPHLDRADSIGLIAKAVDSFREAVEIQHAQARNRTQEAAQLAERKAEMERMLDHFRVSIRESLDRLKLGTQQVGETSRVIRQATANVSGRVDEGSEAAKLGGGAISEVATATNQFAGSIAEIASRSNEAAAVVREASETGKRAEAVVIELASTVDRIASAVSLISSIASQTNLLALNATIEAARAGEAGKGFAVVASEVKELSTGTSKAAAEITDLVKSIESVTVQVTEATRGIGAGLDSINETTLVIAAAVTEQEQVTQDIAANADLASRRSETILASYQEVYSAIAGNASAADALDRLSGEFRESTEAIVGEIEEFLAKMAA